MFLLSFPLSLPFDWTLRCWLCVCCFVLLYFGYYVMLCVKKKKKKKILIINSILSYSWFFSQSIRALFIIAFYLPRLVAACQCTTRWEDRPRTASGSLRWTRMHSLSPMGWDAVAATRPWIRQVAQLSSRPRWGLILCDITERLDNPWDSRRITCLPAPANPRSQASNLPSANHRQLRKSPWPRTNQKRWGECAASGLCLNVIYCDNSSM